MVVFDPATGRGRLAEDVLDSCHSGPGDRQRARRGRCRGGRARHVHARHDRGHERAHRAHGVQGRVRHDEGIRGRSLHPADQPQGALRPPLEQAATARGEPPAVPRARGAARLAGGRGEARRRRGGAAARAHDPRVGGRGGRALPALLVRPHRPRGARQGDPRRGAAGRAGLGLVRGGADLARVRALVDDDRRRLPPPAVRPLRDEPRGLAPQRRHEGRVDDHEVERRRDALRCGSGGADPDRDVGAGGRDDRHRARRARARGDERAHPRHGGHERRRRDPRRRRASGTRPSTRSSGACPPRCR